jgi:hypothetical protein
MLSMMLLFCTSAQAYQYADDIRFAAGSGVVVDDDDSDLDSDHFHITLTPTPAIIQTPFEVSLSVRCVVTSFALFTPTIKSSLSITSLNSRAPPLQ